RPPLMSAMGHQRPVATPAAVAPCPLRSKSGRSTHAAAWPLFGGGSNGRRHTFSHTQKTGGIGGGAEIFLRVLTGRQRRGVAVLHSQFNRVARQLKRETLGFETRAQRDLMLVLHRPIEPTAKSGHSHCSRFY